MLVVGILSKKTCKNMSQGTMIWHCHLTAIWHHVVWFMRPSTRRKSQTLNAVKWRENLNCKCVSPKGRIL